MTTISVTDLEVNYYGKNAVSNATFTLPKGKMIGIVGPNGAGKSSLMKGMMSLVPVQKGEVCFFGSKLKDVRRNIAYVEQRNAIDLTFPIRVEDVVLLGTFPKLGLLRRVGKVDREKARKALGKVDMLPFAKRQISELSGGQLQRVFIARAIVQEAEIIFMDEPFAGIDMTSEGLIVQLLQNLRDEGKTILIVHHDLHKVREYFDHILIINQSIIACGTVKEQFTMENLQRAYGEDFLGGVLA